MWLGKASVHWKESKVTDEGRRLMLEQVDRLAFVVFEGRVSAKEKLSNIS